MRRSVPALAAAAFLSVAGLSGCATTAGYDATPERAADYVALAASTDRLEIESSRLALARSRDPLTRAHAALMIRDHEATSAQLAAAAAEAGVPLPAGLLAPHAAQLDALGRAASFDAAYRQLQWTSHREALALHTNYARRGDRPGLRGVAAVAVPIVRSHLDHLQR